MKSIFISVVHEDSHWIKNIKKWVDKGYLGDNIVITHETEDKRQEGSGAIRDYIKNKIRGASTILVLIGDSTHNHPWIHAEAELALSFHKKILCVRLPNTTGARPPILNRYDEIAFNPNAIIKHL